MLAVGFGLGALNLDDFPAGVVPAGGAYPVGHHAAVALRAFGGIGGCQCQVAAPFVAPRLGYFSFR